MDGQNLVITSTFDRKESYNTLEWTIYPSGWLKMQVKYFPAAYFTTFVGLNFSYPETEMKGVTYTGSGPYRVWKNLMKGTQLGVWKKDYNDSATGEPPWQYPEFKGYYANLYWCDFVGKTQNFRVITDREDIFLRLFTPKKSKDTEYDNMSPTFPNGDISFMNGISAIGTKTQKPETTGPMGMKHVFYDFEKDELPHIYTALKQKYTDDTTNVGTRYVLLEELEELNDEQTIPLLKNLYQDSKGLDLIQSKILAVMPYVDTKSYDWYFKTFTEAPLFDIKNYWELFTPLSDSLAFTAANFDKVLKIGQEKAYRPMVLDLISTMLNADSSSAYLPIIEANTAYLKKHAIKDLDDDIELIKQDKYTKTTNYYLSIFTKLNLLSLADEYTKKAIALDSVPYIKTNALAVRIRKNLPIAQGIIDAQLDSLQSRYVIMRAYHDAGQIDKVAIKYREHSEFAKLLLSDFLSEEYDYPLAINLLGEVKDEGKSYYAFSFTYEEEGEKKNYIGIAGPFDDEKNILKFGTYGAYSQFDLLEEDWMKQAKSLIQIYNSEE